jgi:hypothetical protein
MRQTFVDHVIDISGTCDIYLWNILQILVEHVTGYNEIFAKYTAYLHRISAMQKAV